MKLRSPRVARGHREALAALPKGALVHEVVLRANLAEALARAGERDAAVAQLDAASRAPRGCDEPAVFANLGLLLAEKGAPADAADAYERGLLLAPTDLELLNGLGCARSDLGELQPSLDAFKRAIEAHPDDARARANYRAVAEYAVAIAEAQKRQREGPADAAPGSE